ncbi:MAG: hypothetical protein RO469_04745 [Thermincola sp.]|jgi:hypothetical protein|nr:hypothetical protein [Thermincola sp.]MDT3703817.1 hypothetical protein [Thermincola sp.]
MLMNQAMNLMEKLVNEIRDAPPEDRDHFMKMTLSLVAMGTEAFRTNPDFRRELAKVIDQELQAYLKKN